MTKAIQLSVTDSIAYENARSKEDKQVILQNSKEMNQGFGELAREIKELNKKPAKDEI